MFILIGLAILLVTGIMELLARVPLIGSYIPNFFSAYDFVLYPIGFFFVILQFTQPWGPFGLVVAILGAAVLALSLGVIL